MEEVEREGTLGTRWREVEGLKVWLGNRVCEKDNDFKTYDLKRRSM